MAAKQSKMEEKQENMAKSNKFGRKQTKMTENLDRKPWPLEASCCWWWFSLLTSSQHPALTTYNSVPFPSSGHTTGRHCTFGQNYGAVFPRYFYKCANFAIWILQDWNSVRV